MLSFISAKKEPEVHLLKELIFAIKKGVGRGGIRRKAPDLLGCPLPAPAGMPGRHTYFYKATALLTTSLQPGSAILRGYGPSLPDLRTPKSGSHHSSLPPPLLHLPPDTAALSVPSEPREAGAGPPSPAPPRANFQFSREQRGSAGHVRWGPRAATPSPSLPTPTPRAKRHSVPPRPRGPLFPRRALYRPLHHHPHPRNLQIHSPGTCPSAGR